MARFYSNENFAIDFVLILRSLGHEVLTSYEAGQANQRIPDNEVLVFATEERRIVITFNRDDFVSLHRSGMTHGASWFVRTIEIMRVRRRFCRGGYWRMGTWIIAAYG